MPAVLHSMHRFVTTLSAYVHRFETSFPNEALRKGTINMKFWQAVITAQLSVAFAHLGTFRLRLLPTIGFAWLLIVIAAGAWVVAKHVAGSRKTMVKHRMPKVG